jgi:hypothetical protein
MENSRLRAHAFAAVAGAMLCAASAHVAGAQIYKCTNAQGKVQYQQHPCEESVVQSAVQGKAPPSATVPPPASLDASGRGYFDIALRKATCDHGVPGFASRTDDDFARWKSENAALAQRVESDPEYARRLGEVQRRDAGSTDTVAKADCTGLLTEFALASANKSPDRRYASPKITWATFLSAMRVGRLDAALDCLAEPARSAFGMSNRNASPESLKSFAGAFQAFNETGGEGVFREATAVRSDAGSEILLFRKVGGDWKIADMQAPAARGTPR